MAVRDRGIDPTFLTSSQLTGGDDSNRRVLAASTLYAIRAAPTPLEQRSAVFARESSSATSAARQELPGQRRPAAAFPPVCRVPPERANAVAMIAVVASASWPRTSRSLQSRMSSLLVSRNSHLSSTASLPPQRQWLAGSSEKLCGPHPSRRKLAHVKCSPTVSN